MELYLIRHAQSQNNVRPVEERVEDPPLTDLGHHQAEHLGRSISALRLTRIVTSPFSRALQTAEYLRQATSLLPEVRIDLHELGGCVSGTTFQSMLGRPGLSRADITRHFPGYEIETAIDGIGWWRSQPYELEPAARQRALRLLEETCKRYAQTDERIAYVMHADFKRIFLALFHRSSLDIPYNTSVTRIRVTPDGCHLQNYNSVDHLPQELRTL